MPSSACPLGMSGSHVEGRRRQTGPGQCLPYGSLSPAEGSKWHLLAAFEKQMLNLYIRTAVLTLFPALYHMSGLYSLGWGGGWPLFSIFFNFLPFQFSLKPYLSLSHSFELFISLTVEQNHFYNSYLVGHC